MGDIRVHMPTYRKSVAPSARWRSGLHEPRLDPSTGVTMTKSLQNLHAVRMPMTFFGLLVTGLAPVWAADAPLPVESIRLPPGFTIEVVARVPDARAMAWGANGTLFVGSTGA